MDGMVFVLLIVAMGCGVGAYAIWTDFEARKLRMRSELGADDELLATISRMEARIEVLERIVTDSGRDVAAEIERLERQSTG